MSKVEFIPIDLVERSAETLRYGDRLRVYSRAQQIERRHFTRRAADRDRTDRVYNTLLQALQTLSS